MARPAGQPRDQRAQIIQCIDRFSANREALRNCVVGVARDCEQKRFSNCASQSLEFGIVPSQLNDRAIETMFTERHRDGRDAGVEEGGAPFGEERGSGCGDMAHLILLRRLDLEEAGHQQIDRHHPGGDVRHRLVGAPEMIDRSIT